jgi:ABC-type uncharacterized transport system ATPase subunit
VVCYKIQDLIVKATVNAAYLSNGNKPFYNISMLTVKGDRYNTTTGEDRIAGLFVYEDRKRKIANFLKETD